MYIGFAYLFMKSKNLFAKHMYTSFGVRYSTKALVDAVEHTDIKIAERQELGAEQAKEQAKQKREERREQRTSTSREVYSPSGNIKQSKAVMRTKTTGTTKNVSTVKTTRKIPKKK